MHKRRRLSFEPLETRIALSGATAHKASIFTANLTTAAVVLPVEPGGTQITGANGAPLYPLPGQIAGQKDRSKGFVQLAIADNGTAIKISGRLHNISNVSAITLRDLDYPAIYIASGGGQVTASNIGQSVAVLDDPGPGSGPFIHPKFTATITSKDFIGPLAGRRMSVLISQLRQSTAANPTIYVLVQTNNGTDPASGAQQPGNFPNGELRGTVTST
jgi:hypothetical protein